MTEDVKKTAENLKSRDNLDMGSDIQDRKKQEIYGKELCKKTENTSRNRSYGKLDKTEEEKEKLKSQRLKRMQQKKKKKKILRISSQFKYNQIQTWIVDGSHENFENREKGEEDRQTAVDFKEKPNRFEERQITRQITPKPEKQEKLIKSAENQFLEKIITRQSLNKDLPYFARNPLEWQNFITQFQETTDLCQFSDRENMSRLQKCLKGKAKETVHTLLNFPNKLKDVLQLLERRFGRKEDIIEQIFTQLKHTKQVREENLENLVELSNTLQNMTVCLESPNYEEYLINPQILGEMIDKMLLNLTVKNYRNVCSL
ncbi:hypothetical protein JTB14_017019 [Gonioctena quinquepunctata]|nr:hypothetical protein JTB14_017019 [Gonioctena quinquepunctata]